jgi:ribosomal protein L32
MNKALKFVRPVISLDAAHLCSKFKGTLYVASVLTGNNDVFPIGFMIAAGIENRETRVQMLTYLKEACPIVSQQGRQLCMVNDHAPVCETFFETSFVFVSDRNKGLKEAVKEVFPTNLEYSCAQHIRANVTQRFGRKTSQYVMAIAKTYSARYAEMLMDKTKRVKPQAALCIQKIEEGGVMWKSSQWTSGWHYCPPRFGIVTSNTSESVNSMFAGARDFPWMGAFEQLVNLLSSRICKLQTMYSKRDEGEVVPRVQKILKASWEKTAAMTVLEIEEGCGDFEVVSPEYGDPEDDKVEDIIVGVDVPKHLQNLHIMKPECRWCSCGTWQQDCMIPCQHAMAVYRFHKGNDLAFMLSELVGDYHKFGYGVKKTFKQNSYPVSTDFLKSDGTTLTPLVKQRGAGRPKTKRIWHRSEYRLGDDSAIICSNCGRRGHNKRTCLSLSENVNRECHNMQKCGGKLTS